MKKRTFLRLRSCGSNIGISLCRPGSLLSRLPYPASSPESATILGDVSGRVSAIFRHRDQEAVIRSSFCIWLSSFGPVVATVFFAKRPFSTAISLELATLETTGASVRNESKHPSPFLLVLHFPVPPDFELFTSLQSMVRFVLASWCGHFSLAFCTIFHCLAVVCERWTERCSFSHH